MKSEDLKCPMNIFYFLMEGKPLPSNDESKECAGAYINCWVNSNDEISARNKAIKHIRDVEGWQVLNIEEVYVAKRQWYKNKPDSLKCFDMAVDSGIGLILNIWTIGCEDE